MPHAITIRNEYASFRISEGTVSTLYLEKTVGWEQEADCQTSQNASFGVQVFLLTLIMICLTI